jgi:hypothetical protein
VNVGGSRRGVSRSWIDARPESSYASRICARYFARASLLRPLRPRGGGGLFAHGERVDIERVQSAYRLATIIALLYAFWIITPTVWPHVRNYMNVVAGHAYASRTDSVDPNKLSAAKLESMLVQSEEFPSDSQPHCRAADRDWDYLCTYLPAASQSRLRLQFGVNVDSTHWLKVSSIVREGGPVPAPQ